jgi:hypothetical protein
VEVKIGVQSVPREIVVETDTSAEEVERLLSTALAAGEHAVFALSVAKGGRIVVPADKIAYVEFGGAETRRVGFGNLGLCRAGRVGPVVSGLSGLSCRAGPNDRSGPAPGMVDND